MASSTWMILAAVAAVFVWRTLRGMGGSANPAVADALAAGALLVDVRSPAEFQGGHLPGAKNVPLPVLASRLKEIGDVDTAVVLYCRSGARSGSATKVLLNAGYSRALNGGAMGSLAAVVKSGGGAETAEASAEGLNRAQRRQQQRQQRRRAR